MISFSIIIPLYNKEKSVAGTINSVLSQSYGNFELIVVNDGSTDNSLTVVQSFQDSRIRIIDKQNGGVCSARNKGIEAAKYEYIAFLDADDMWDTNYLQEQVKMIENYSDAAMWGMNWIERTKDEDVLLDTGLPSAFCGYVQNYWTLKHVSDLFFTSSVVIRKESFNAVGNFDERIRYSEDLDMWYRIILNYPVVFNSKPMVVYSQESENRAMKKKVPLKAFLPYYVDKYEKYCDTNKDFSHFIHTFAAANILPYYFSNTDEKRDAKVAVKKLRYSDIHYKYSLLYKTPRFVGRIFLKLIELRHR